jgi:hypothetical protein
MPYTCNRCNRRIDIGSAVVMSEDDILCHSCYDHYYDYFKTVIEEEMNKGRGGEDIIREVIVKDA